MYEDFKDALDVITEWWCLAIEAFIEYCKAVGNAVFDLLLIVSSPFWVIPYYYKVYKKEQEEYIKHFKQFEENTDE